MCAGSGDPRAHLSSEVTQISRGHGHGAFPSGELDSSPRRLHSPHPRLQPMGPAQTRWASALPTERRTPNWANSPRAAVSGREAPRLRPKADPSGRSSQDTQAIQ